MLFLEVIRLNLPSFQRCFMLVLDERKVFLRQIEDGNAFPGVISHSSPLSNLSHSARGCSTLTLRQAPVPKFWTTLSGVCFFVSPLSPLWRCLSFSKEQSPL